MPARVEVVHRRDHRQPVVTAEPGDELERLLLMTDVERARRLVEQQDRRFGRQRPGDHQSLLLAAAQLAQLAVGELGSRRAARARRPPSPGPGATRCRSSRRTAPARAARTRRRSCRAGAAGSVARTPPVPPAAFVTSTPSRPRRRRISPSCGTRPTAARSSDDLPAPLGPISPSHPPEVTVASNWRTTSRFP